MSIFKQAPFHRKNICCFTQHVVMQKQEGIKESSPSSPELVAKYRKDTREKLKND